MSIGEQSNEGTFLHSLAHELFSVNRSITGDGVRATLVGLQTHLPELRIHEVPSGTPVLDWTIPEEWHVNEAFIEDPSGLRIIDFDACNIHLVNYSIPIEARLSLEELLPHLHVDAENPDAIPYITSYYDRTWGFCLTERQRAQLEEGVYRVLVDSTLTQGSLTYADFVLPGDSSAEVLITTYVCHPSLANNELSGPMVALGLARWLKSLPHRRYTYRFVFAPETIGAITYIAHNLELLRKAVIAGVNLTCIGDDRHYSYLASRLGNSPLDRIAKRQVRRRPNALTYSFLDRGSDERHYGMPGVDLPIISLMRTKYGEYPEYHTHLDDLTVVTPTGLQGGLDFARDCIRELEISNYPQSTVLGEPQLGKRGLYHTLHARTVTNEVLLRTHILAYSDGQHSIQDLSELLETPQEIIAAFVGELEEHGLITQGALCAPGLSSHP